MTTFDTAAGARRRLRVAPYALIVPTVVKFGVGKDQSNPIRITIALVALAILVGVIWNSKRRGSSLMAHGSGPGGGAPASPAAESVPV